MSGLPISAGTPDLGSAAGGAGGDIHMSNMSNSNSNTTNTNTNTNTNANTGYTINDHDYDGLVYGASSASASTSTAIGAVPLSDNSYTNSSHFGSSSQETSYMNPNHNSHNHNNSNINSNNNNSHNHNGGLGLGSNIVSTRDSGLDEGLTRRVTLTHGATGVSEAKLKRFLDHNQRLRDQLEMRRVPVSEASNSLIQYITTTRDPLLPVIWGTVGQDPFAKQSTGCCTIS
ncbi:hypothetical protein BGZ76_001205 [Entomortierella beljakovae]|nr:hypothetical protein BGZ76_001205 [Entomortierella beljakovae]